MGLGLGGPTAATQAQKQQNEKLLSFGESVILFFEKLS
jgi:hypothetical protein